MWGGLAIRGRLLIGLPLAKTRIGEWRKTFHHVAAFPAFV
jgi:hypothetical protein